MKTGARGQRASVFPVSTKCRQNASCFAVRVPSAMVFFCFLFSFAMLSVVIYTYYANDLFFVCKQIPCCREGCTCCYNVVEDEYFYFGYLPEKMEFRVKPVFCEALHSTLVEWYVFCL